MRMSEKKKECAFYAGILAVSLLLFTLVGERGYYEYPDSWQYIGLTGGEGIMPTYPLFIHLHRVILGEGRFLYGVVASQTALTVTCLMLYLLWIRKRFCPGYLVSALIFIVSLVPFTLDFPALMGNHAILTEALTYPLFYLFVIVFTETAIRKKYGWVCLTVLMGLALALVRTQMQICLGFAAAVFWYVVWRKSAGKRRRSRLGRMLAGLLVCGGIVVAGEVCLLQINGRLQRVVADCREELARSVYIEEQMREIASVKAEISGISGDLMTVSARENEGNKDIGESDGAVENMTGQLDSILIDRTFYEMDAEDWRLFEDSETQELFHVYYRQMDSKKALHIYARNGLWKWKDIMNGTASGAGCMYSGWLEYVRENPDSQIADSNYWMQVNRKIAFALLKKHWPRMLYHTLCMLPQGFICTVFFQKETVYGLCHLYTLLVYCAAIALLAIGWKKKAVVQERCEFMLSALFLNIGMVVVISVIFFGMQRYLIYGFGVFYAALLLILEQLYRAYGRLQSGKARVAARGERYGRKEEAAPDHSGL